MTKMRGYKDKFGVTWYLPKQGLYPKCGQSDNYGDCNCKKLTKEDVRILKED